MDQRGDDLGEGRTGERGCPKGKRCRASAAAGGGGAWHWEQDGVIKLSQDSATGLWPDAVTLGHWTDELQVKAIGQVMHDTLSLVYIILLFKHADLLEQQECGEYSLSLLLFRHLSRTHM